MFQTVLALTAALFLMTAALFLMTAAAPSASTADSQPGDATLSIEQSATIGAKAPDFTATDSHGKEINLSDFKGKTVVLEWTNHGCPYVRKFYDTHTMQDMQKDATDRGMIWLSIVSSRKGAQGFTTPDQANALIDREDSHATARILDTDGTLGRLYGASTTPHMYIIDADGVLAYAGAIDDQPSVAHDSLKGAKNYVKLALQDLANDKPPTTSTSKPYGCGVKY